MILSSTSPRQASHPDNSSQAGEKAIVKDYSSKSRGRMTSGRNAIPHWGQNFGLCVFPSKVLQLGQRFRWWQYAAIGRNTRIMQVIATTIPPPVWNMIAMGNPIIRPKPSGAIHHAARTSLLWFSANVRGTSNCVVSSCKFG